MSDLPKQYSKIAITLHWVIAVMVFMALFIGGGALAEIKNSNPEKISALQGHMIWGSVVGVLMLIRLVVRFTTRKPVTVQTGNALLDRIGAYTHALLYLLIISMVVAGLGIAIMAGLPDVVFLGHGELPASFDDLLPRAAHGLIAKILMAVIVLHVVGALYHQFILKDNLLSRMGIGKTGD